MPRYFLILALILFVLTCSSSLAGEPDPYLAAKADEYQAFLEQWHTGGLGGLTAGVRFTDETRTAVDCVQHQGDSTIWTGMYLASQALRYRVTGDPAARAEVLRIARYLHQLMDITDTPGYIARYVGENVWPWNCHYPDGHGGKVHGTGEWEGYFWIDNTSRDQYCGWWFGLSMAYEAVDDEAMRATIRQDFADVICMLVLNRWNITDQHGEWTGNGAAWVGPIMRLAWLVQAAHAIDEPYYWELLEEQYRINRPVLWIDTLSFLNRYYQYYGNNLRHLAFQPIFRLWPDCEELCSFYWIWEDWNRPWVRHVHNPWFDAVHVTACSRLGVCNPVELQAIRDDALNTLYLFWDPPNYQREITCSEMPLDPFSVWADEFIRENPWLQGIVDVDPQTAEAREVNDRPWTDMYWQSDGVFAASCHSGEDPTYTGAGMDYLLAYWIGIYHGLLPGGGGWSRDRLRWYAPSSIRHQGAAPVQDRNS